jgi:uncharacterized protein (DUF885 family)
MPRVVPWVLLPVLAAALTNFCAGEVSDNGDAALAAFFKNYLDKDFHLRPLEATRLGDHRFDHLLEDISPKGRDSWVEHWRTALRELSRQIRYDKLSRAGQIDFEIFHHHLSRLVWMAETLHAFELGDNTGSFEQDPRIYTNYISDSTFLLLTQSSLPAATNIKNCIARMAEIPRIVQIAKECLRDPPRVFLETAIRQNRGSIAFYETGIFDVVGKSELLPDLERAVRPLVASLKDYQRFLEEDLLPKAMGDWRIGKENFARKLDLELNAGLSADQVLHEAEREAERVRAEMYVVARQLWSLLFYGKALPPDDPGGRLTTIREVLTQLNREHHRAEDLVRDAKAIVEEVKDFISSNDILRLPRPDRCQVIDMPEFQRGNTAAYLNPAPPLDLSASSVYALSPPPRGWDARRVNSYLEEYNRYMLHILTIHEGYPGHYVQLEYSRRHPSLVRRVLYSGVFAEGWAVYCEQMMLDQGYGRSPSFAAGWRGEGDPFTDRRISAGDRSILALRLNQLKFYLRSVINAILDNKMHSTQMTDAEALKFLVEGAFQTEGEALAKIVRAKQSSCQLSTYFVGRTAFYRLRQQIQREQGDQFNLGRYHEAVLDHGTLPVKYLPELVRARLTQPR